MICGKIDENFLQNFYRNLREGERKRLSYTTLERMAREKFQMRFLRRVSREDCNKLCERDPLTSNRW